MFRTHIGHSLVTNDVQRVRDWYLSLLGCDPSVDLPGQASFYPSTGALHVFDGGDASFPVWGVAALEDTVDALQQAGAVLHSTMVNAENGSSITVLTDPFGFLFGITPATTSRATIVCAPPQQIAAHDGLLANIEVRRSCVVPRARARVFRDWTDSAALTGWLGVEANIELRIGGRFELLFLPEPTGLRGSEGCRVLSFLPDRLLCFTWNAPPHLPSVRSLHTWVVLAFTDVEMSSTEDHRAPQPIKTHIQLTHSGWPAAGWQVDGDPAWSQAVAYFEVAWGRMLQAYVDHVEAAE